jgi:serine/threonine protein kinase
MDLSDILDDKKMSSQGANLSNLIIGSYQIILGLQHAHDNDIHHFDIKPANTMVSNWTLQSMNFKITDFGLAQSSVKTDESEVVRKFLSQNSSSDLTRQVCGGTPLFMTPELRERYQYISKM